MTKISYGKMLHQNRVLRYENLGTYAETAPKPGGKSVVVIPPEDRRHVLHPSVDRAYEADVTGLSPQWRPRGFGILSVIFEVSTRKRSPY